jgi:hypothetical protein
MQLKLRDPRHTNALATFLRSLGQVPRVVESGIVELPVPETGPEGEAARLEVEIYLRVWKVLHPDAQVARVE